MDKILVFGHKNPDTDTICSAIVMEEIQNKMGLNVEAVRLGEINKETEYVLNYFNVKVPRLIEKVDEGQEVMLVDHNEFNQSVDGIENAKITMVIDHHKINNFSTKEPLMYYAEPIGCTATAIYKLCIVNNEEISKKMAELMLSAIISDTLLFKSPTTTPWDKKAAEELAKIAEIDIESFGLEMLKAGTNLDEYSEEQLINIDAKKFEKNGVNYIIAQVNTVSIEDVLKRQQEIEKAINKCIEENKLDLFIFTITDILNCNSEIIALGNRIDIVEKEYKLENNRAYLEGVVSRKKQLAPMIEKNI